MFGFSGLGGGLGSGFVGLKMYLVFQLVSMDGVASVCVCAWGWGVSGVKRMQETSFTTREFTVSVTELGVMR